MANFKFIDLFAGIGGFHIAMHELGGECVFASEIDKFARQTYEYNFKEISPKLFESGNFNVDITSEELNYSDIPSFDVLCAGFPCQPFSNAGLRKGFDDTRGTLFFNIKEIIKTKIDDFNDGKTDIFPRVILLENVKGFKNHDGGKTFKIIKKTLSDLGYNVAADVLNTRYFGLPQNRERIFIVAWHKSYIYSEDFLFPHGVDADGLYIYDRSEREARSVKTKLGSILFSKEELERIEEREKKSYRISKKLWEGHKRRRAEHGLKGNGFGYSIFDSSSPYTSTISARYYKDGSEILVKCSESETNIDQPRKLHPFEAARLQGFPVDSWYALPVSANQSYKQFGNSVSIPVVKAVGEEILRQLFYAQKSN